MPERTTFFEEQARHRKQSLRFAAVGAVTVALAGIPLSIVVSPVLFLTTLTAAHLIQLQWPLPPSFWAAV